MDIQWQWDDDFELPFYTFGIFPTRIIIPVPNSEAFEYAKTHMGTLLCHKWGHEVCIRKMYRDYTR